MTEEVELTKTQKYVALFLVGLVIGSTGSYLIFSDGVKKDVPYEVVMKFEEFLNEITKIRPGLVSDHTTISQTKNMYFLYRPVSTKLLKYVLSDVCNDWDTVNIELGEDYNKTLATFCEDVCYG